MISRGTIVTCLALLVGGVSAAELDGILTWARRAELGTLVSGAVTAVPVRVGQSVSAGDELLRLDDRGFKAGVAAARATVRRLKGRHAEAKREDERAVELYDRTVLSDRERQLALIAFQEAEADLVAARARLSQAQLDLERSRILAPYDATVVGITVAVGEIVVSELQSTPLIVVAEDGRLLATATVGAQHLGALQPGTTVRVQVRGQWHDGCVAELGLEPVSGSGRDAAYLVKASFISSSASRLHAGEPATIQYDD